MRHRHPSVVAPRYRHGTTEWHFVLPGNRRTACGAVPSARIPGRKKLVTVTCPGCMSSMWHWGLRTVIAKDHRTFDARLSGVAS